MVPTRRVRLPLNRWPLTRAEARAYAESGAIGGLAATLGVPNKPMVPTASNELDGNSPDPLRRHIGQSLGSQSGRR